MSPDIYVQTAALPARVRAITIEHADGSFTVLVNEDLREEVKESAAHHELIHIEEGDFEKFDVDLIEWIAHGGV